MGEIIYRDYDRTALDQQLNLRARWPEYETYFTRWADSSEAARSSLDCKPDLAYGDSEGQRLDFFPALPLSDGGMHAPLLVFIHGGYWQSLDKSDFSYLAQTFVERGVAFAALNYDLAPEVSLGDMVTQIGTAMAWIHGNATRNRVDRERLYLAGHSSGGHLTAMALSMDWGAKHDLPQDVIKGGVSVSGIYDLEPIMLSYQQPVLKLDAKQVESLSPIRNLPSEAPPLLCAVGAEEMPEFLVQQSEFVAAWGAAGNPVRAIELPGANHFTAVDCLSDPDHPLGKAVLDMIFDRAAEA